MTRSLHDAPSRPPSVHPPHLDCATPPHIRLQAREPGAVMTLVALKPPRDLNPGIGPVTSTVH
jgi:hypothetical protein